MNILKNDSLNKALDTLGFKKLTDVQERVIPSLLKHQDVIVEANTGSGKTHAFLLPIFDQIDLKSATVQALILAPTRELATQIHQFATTLAEAADLPLTIDLFIGGVDRDDILRKLDLRMPHIAIGTPGRIQDLVIKENVLKAYMSRYFIIDEADMTLEHHFMEQVSDILGVIQPECTKAVFSATIPESLKPFLKKYLRQPEIINVHPEDISSLQIEHYFFKTREQNRIKGLASILGAINPYLAAVFCNTKESAEAVYQWMKDTGYSVVLFHGGIDYRKRKQLMKRINALEFQYVVATDIFSRGIDVLGISHIINYELPSNIEFYIHRTGRTGRMEFNGVALSLYEFDDNSYLDRLESKGVHCVYKDIRDKEIVDATLRRKRQKREWKENDLDREAKNKVRRPKQVKPGYKKKYRQEVEKTKKKLARKKH